MKYANFKRMTAMTMAAAMMCSPVVTMAAEASSATSSDVTDETAANAGSLTGDADLKYAETDVFCVKLPTVSNLDFTLDPQGLLKVADGTNFTIGKGGLYFANATGTPNHSNKSDDIVFYNKSSFDVSVAVSAELTIPQDVDIDVATSETDLTDVSKPTIKLTLKESGDSQVVYLKNGKVSYGEKKAERVPEVSNSGDKGYQFVTESGSGIDAKVVYQLTAGFKDTDVKANGKLTYNLEGACDTKADWAEVETDNIAVKLTWKISKVEAAPDETTVDKTSIKMTGDTVRVDFPTGESLASIKYATAAAPTTFNTLDAKYYTKTATVNGVEVVFEDLTELSAGKIKFVATTTTPDNDIEIEVSQAPTNVAPSIAETDYDLIAGQQLEVSFDLGVGDKAATGISKIVNVNTGADIPAARYKVQDNKIVFDATFTTNNASNAASGAKYRVEFNDTASTKVEVTFTTKNN